MDWSTKSREPNLSTIETFEYDDGAPPGWRDIYQPSSDKMRFGLATALVGGGFYSYEIDNVNRGALGLPWFDEYDNGGTAKGYLGLPTGPPREAEATLSGPELLDHGSFDSPADLSAWSFIVNAGTSATARIDTSDRHSGTGSLRVDVTKSVGQDWGSVLCQNVAFPGGTEYTISFWARADKQRPLTAWVPEPTGTDDWVSFPHAVLTTEWQRFELPGTCSGGARTANMYLGFGETAGTVWIDDVSLVPGSREVIRRDFEHGTALVNPSERARTLDVGPGLRHLAGVQAPLPNDGLPVTSVTIPAHDGLVLVSQELGTPPFVTIAGTTRYDTALQASRAEFADGSCDTVVLATGTGFPDALGAAGLAGIADCPILLVSGTSPTAELKAEIARLTWGHTGFKVYVIGGTAAVSAQMTDALAGLYGSKAVVRLAGGTRYQTAAAVAAEMSRRAAAQGLPYDGSAFVVSGTDYPDALLVGPVAYARHMPILLTSPADTGLSDALSGAGISDAVIVGSTTSVPLSAEDALRDDLGTSHVQRPCSATDRYSMARAVADWSASHAGFGWEGVGVTTGANFPDALAAAPLLGRHGSVIMLTPPTSLDPQLAALLAQHRTEVAPLRFFGGTGAISVDVRESVRSVLGALGASPPARRPGRPAGPPRPCRRQTR